MTGGENSVDDCQRQNRFHAYRAVQDARRGVPAFFIVPRTFRTRQAASQFVSRLVPSPVSYGPALHSIYRPMFSMSAGGALE